MLNGSKAAADADFQRPDCAFCQHGQIAHILKETPDFILAADHAPLLEGHLLIIPKRHYTCYGDAPAALDAGLFALKHEVQQFCSRFYLPPVFWEHGIFRQTVFHAHLHCFPWGTTGYDPASNLHSAIVTSQDDIRAWHTTHGQYFYLEDAQIALLFAPEIDRYFSIVQGVFWRGAVARGNTPSLRTPQQRYAEGAPLIEAVMTKWNAFRPDERTRFAGQAGSAQET